MSAKLKHKQKQILFEARVKKIKDKGEGKNWLKAL